MPFQTERDGPAFKATIEIEAIANGYLASLVARPSREDPMGQRRAVLFASSTETLGEACAALIALQSQQSGGTC